VWFEGLGEAPTWWVKAECGGLNVLVCCVEGVAQVHEECVAVLLEAILDV
jgi:hypothetical protein